MNKKLHNLLFYIRLLKIVVLILVINVCTFQAKAQSTYNWKNVTILGGGFIPAIVYSTVSKNLIYARTDIGGFYRWSATTGAWIPLNDAETSYNLTGGESIAPDPVDSNVVYMAAGMYLSSGNGVILRSANQGIYRTANTIGIPMGGTRTGRGMGERLAVDPNNTQILYFASRNNGLYKSSNAASSWAQVTSFPVLGDNGYGLSFVTFNKASGSSGTGSSTIFVGVAAATSTNSNLYVSTNSGASWNIVTGGPTGMMPSHGILGSDGNLWLSYTNDYGPYNVRGVTLSGQIWKYNTTSGVWTNVTPPTANWGGTAGGLSVDAQNPLHVVVSTLDWYTPDRLLATTNGGSTWNVIAQPPVSYWSTGVSTYNVNGAQYQDANGTALVGTGATNWVQAVAINPFNSNNVMYGTGAGIWASTNAGSAAANGNGAGTTWTFQDQGLEQTACLGLVPSVKGAFFSTLGDIEGTRSTNLAVAGTQIGAPYSGNTPSLDFAENDSAIVVKVTNGTPLVAYSIDNGQTWTACAGTPNGSSAQDVAVSANGSTFVYAPSNAVASYSTNNGQSWTTCGGAIPSGARVAADRVNSNIFYAVSGGTIYTSTNGGQTFTQTATGVASGLPRPVFGVQGEFWLATGSALYKVTGTGATVTKITNVTACNAVGFGKAASGQTHPAVFIIGTVGGAYGFYRSDNNATSWNQTNDSQHEYSSADYCTGDEFVYGRMYVGTNGRGILYGDIQTATAPPATITVATTTTFCTGGSVVLNANTGIGYTYQWNKGGAVINAATGASYTASTAGSYTVTVSSGGLSTTSSPTTVTVNALPPYQPVIGTTPVCEGSSSVTYSITPTSGNTYAWTVPASVGTIVGSSTGSAITISVANTVGSGTIKVSEKNTSGCSSLKSDSITVTVINAPPYQSVMGISPVCAGSSSVTYSIMPTTGNTYAWTVPASVGTIVGSSTGNNVTVNIANVSGNGTIKVSEKNTSGCSSLKSDSILVMVNATPAAPTVRTPLNYCQNGAAPSLTATGSSLLWYTASKLGVGSTTAPAPSTTTIDTTYFYVSQTTNGCESPRASIEVIILPLPQAPTVTSPINYCQGANASALTAVATTSSPSWYTTPNATTGSYTAPTPSTATVGTTNYYVTQWIQSAAGVCTSPKAEITVNVNAIPAAPTVTTPISYCQNATATALTATATGTLNWYTVATAGTASTTAPTPSTTVTGTTSYYVSQTTNACESPRAAIAVTVSAPPTASNAGAAQYITSTSANLSANVPATGTGTWSVLSGTATFANSISATSSVSGLSAGANVLQWTIANGSCPSSSSAVTINVGTSPTTQTISGPAYVTPNETGVAYSVPDDNGSHYLWSLPTGATIASHNADSSQITVNYGTSGGTVSVTETNPYGTASSSLPVSVGNAPTTQTITGEIYVPINSTGVAYSIPDNSGSHYLWSLPTGATIASHNADSSQITVDYGTNGGTVSVTEANPYGTASSSLPVSVGATPTTQTITGPATVAANETGVVYSIPDNNGSTYHWTIPAGASISMASTDSSQITVSFGSTGGTITVTETNPYGNATSTLPVSISSTTAVIAGSRGDSYEVKPNPFSDYTTIIVHHSTTEQITLSVINVQGISCFTSSQYYTNQEFTIGSELTTDGVYFVQLSYGAEVKVLKLVKVR